MLARLQLPELGASSEWATSSSSALLPRRFRQDITIETSDGEVGPASGFVPSNGRARRLSNVKITHKRVLVTAVVLVKARAMKEPWILATSRPEDSKKIVALYGRRFTIEENFAMRRTDDSASASGRFALRAPTAATECFKCWRWPPPS